MTFPVDPGLKPKVNEQLQATVSQLPLQMTDAVLSYINYFNSDRGRKTLLFGLKRAGRYKPMIQRILAEEGVPQELIYLPKPSPDFCLVRSRTRPRSECGSLFSGAAASTDRTRPPTRMTGWIPKRQLVRLLATFGIYMTSSVTGIWRLPDTTAAMAALRKPFNARVMPTSGRFEPATPSQRKLRTTCRLSSR